VLLRGYAILDEQLFLSRLTLRIVALAWRFDGNWSRAFAFPGALRQRLVLLSSPMLVSFRMLSIERQSQAHTVYIGRDSYVENEPTVGLQ